MYGKSCTGSSGKKSGSLFCLYSLRSATKEILFLPLPWCLQQHFPSYTEGVLHRGLCRVPVVLQRASNLSDLVLSDQLRCQKTCKSLTAASHLLKTIILSSCQKDLQTVVFQCLERTGSITEHLKFETGEGGKCHQPGWKVKLQTEFAVNRVHSTVYLKQFLSRIV